MSETGKSAELLRILTETQAQKLERDVLEIAMAERPEAITNNLVPVKEFIHRGVCMIHDFENATHGRHPEISAETDVVYIDSGPGPYDHKFLPKGKTDLEDFSYHKYPWSRRMDRARIRVGYALACTVAAKRSNKSAKELTAEELKTNAPYLMYTSTTWQNAHITTVIEALRKEGNFKIPPEKIVMYDEYFGKDGERKKIVHTEDQIEGLQFPSFEGEVPRRVVIVSHPAHLMRIFHILGKYPEKIPPDTTVQAFPIPTPTNAVTEYAKIELLGTLGTVFGKNRANLLPYNQYQL